MKYIRLGCIKLNRAGTGCKEAAGNDGCSATKSRFEGWPTVGVMKHAAAQAVLRLDKKGSARMETVQKKKNHRRPY